MKPSQFVPPLFVLLWATGFIGARYAMPWAEPFFFLAARFALTILILALLVVVIGAKRIARGQALHAGIVGILMHGTYLGGVFWAVAHGMPAGFAALIAGLQPLIAAVLSGVFLGERISPRHWAGLAAGFIGVVIVISPRMTAVDGIALAPLLACIVAVLAISTGTIWQKRFVGNADLLTSTLCQYIGGLAVALIVALTFETGAYTLTGELVFAMVWLVFVLSIGAVFLLMYLIREGEVSSVSSLFFLVPSVTAVLAWLLFGESLSAIQIVGMVITTVGVAIATRPQFGTRARASK